MRISLSNQHSHLYVENVLARMAYTIDPSHAIKTDQRHQNGFTPRSCYGSVAHYIKDHPGVKGIIYLFTGPGSLPDEVSHCCLYSMNGKVLKDTYNQSYGGKPVVQGDRGYYDVGPNGPPIDEVDDYKLIKKLTVEEFFKQYFNN